jgi:hypothetical protein
VLVRVLVITLVAGALVRVASAERAGLVVIRGKDAATEEARLASAAAQAWPDVQLDPSPMTTARSAYVGGAVAGETLADFASARSLMIEGWRAFQQVNIAGATDRLRAAQLAAEPLLGIPGGYALYADIAIRLGVVVAHRGDSAAAGASIRLATALDPDRELTLTEFSPDALDVIARARRDSPEAATVTLRVDDPGLRIELDGALLAAGIRSVAASEGQHVVVLRRGQRAVGRRVVVVERGATVDASVVEPVDSTLAALSRGLTWGGPLDAAGATLEETLRYAELGAIALVASVWRRGEATLLLQWCRYARALSCSEIVEVGHGDVRALGAALVEARRQAQAGSWLGVASLVGDARLGASESRPHGCRWCRSPWLWSGVAAVAIAVTAFVVSRGEFTPRPAVVVDPGDFTRR